MTLRHRILRDGICCLPWKQYGGEIRCLPISSQTLFRRSGVPWDILETSLKAERYLVESEDLWGVLSQEENLKRYPHDQEYYETLAVNNWDIPEDWDDEDYEIFKGKNSLLCFPKQDW